MIVLYRAGSAGNVVLMRDTEKPVQAGKEPNPRTLFRGNGYSGFYQASEFMRRYAAAHGFKPAPADDRIFAGMYVKEGVK